MIGADTLIAFMGRVIGKPKSIDEAKKTLRDFSGTYHSVYTGITVIDSSTNQIISESTETKVYFRELEDAEIESYIANGNVLDKAGSYAYQDKAAAFVEKIEGDYYTIVGLPISKLSSIFKQFGVNLLTP